jgi:TetR/AcrR family transcriptional repressor of bet genes
MAVQPINQIRREEFIKAAIDSIHKYGLHDATVNRIARDLGVSAGNIHYYFGGKDGLFEAAMHRLLSRIRERSALQLAMASLPEERLLAIISANLSPDVFQPAFCRAWLHFLAESKHRPAFQRLQRINGMRVRSNIRSILRKIATPTLANVLTEELVALLDGLWAHRAQVDEGLEPAEALAFAKSFLDHRLAMHRLQLRPAD